MSSALVLAATLVGLAGCDGSVGLRGPTGTLERTSGKKLVRGWADRLQQVHEEQERTNARRDAYEAIAKRQGFDLSDDLGSLLKDNAAYREVTFTNLAEGMPGLPGYPLQVEFDIDGGYKARLQFLVEETTMLGFLHVSRLPMFDNGSVRHGDDVLPIPSNDVLGLVLAGDHNALKARADKTWGAVTAQREAASAAAAASAASDKQAACDQQVHDQAGHFEPDASLGEAQKQAATDKFNADQAAALKECLSR